MQSETKSNNPKTSSFYKLFSALSAFILWGGWAYYINSVKGDNSGLISGLTQGAASFIITLIMVYSVTRIYHTLFVENTTSNNIFRLLLPAILTVSVTGTCLFIIHSLVSTPHIAKTITPALCVAFVFSVFTTYKLQKRQQLPKLTKERA